MSKLTRNAQFLMIGFMFLIIIGIGLIISFKTPTSSNEIITVVKENVQIKSVYIDSIAVNQNADNYTSYKITINKDDEIEGYKITNEQTFTKYLKLEGPKEKETLTDSKEVVTHYVYCGLLTGDIIEKDDDGKKTYEIVNARITYTKIPVVLTKDNKIKIYKDKEIKSYDKQEFLKKLDSIKDRKEVIE
jgi:hypothetical protein